MQLAFHTHVCMHVCCSWPELGVQVPIHQDSGSWGIHSNEMTILPKCRELLLHSQAHDCPNPKTKNWDTWQSNNKVMQRFHIYKYPNESQWPTWVLQIKLTRMKEGQLPFVFSSSAQFVQRFAPHTHWKKLRANNPHHRCAWWKSNSAPVTWSSRLNLVVWRYTSLLHYKMPPESSSSSRSSHVFQQSLLINKWINNTQNGLTIP